MALPDCSVEDKAVKKLEADVFKQQGFGQTMGIGRRPALVIVDFVVAFDDPKMLAAAISTKLCCGPSIC